MINLKHIKQYFLLALILPWTGGWQLLAQPDAFFTADTNRVNSLEVIFQSNYTEADTLTYSFQWNFGDGETGVLPVATHLYSKAGVYLVTLIVSDLTDSDTFSLRITVRDELFVPNVFTPNEDGLNDFFVVRTDGIKVYSLTIFTRSGVRLTTITGTTLAWDGKTTSGKKAAPGVYYYILSDDLGVLRKGFLHLFY
ncbi:MAG: T9SS type B sorting domain-containing protein [Chlorobi bacterium]|nr:T9SS type B sorting domain-containing protein [Chlorobiota bacterium]